METLVQKAMDEAMVSKKSFTDAYEGLLRKKYEEIMALRMEYMEQVVDFINADIDYTETVEEINNLSEKMEECFKRLWSVEVLQGSKREKKGKDGIDNV